MAKRLTAAQLRQLNRIAERYHFRDDVEVDEENAPEFVDNIAKAMLLGLHLDKYDDWYITDVWNKLFM